PTSRVSACTIRSESTSTSSAAPAATVTESRGATSLLGVPAAARPAATRRASSSPCRASSPVSRRTSRPISKPRPRTSRLPSSQLGALFRQLPARRCEHVVQPDPPRLGARTEGRAERRGLDLRSGQRQLRELFEVDPVEELLARRRPFEQREPPDG